MRRRHKRSYGRFHRQYVERLMHGVQMRLWNVKMRVKRAAGIK